MHLYPSLASNVGAVTSVTCPPTDRSAHEPALRAALCHPTEGDETCQCPGCSRRLRPSPQDALCPLDALSGYRYVKTPSLPSRCPMFTHWMPYLATGMSKLPPSPQNALRPLDALSGHMYVKTPSLPSKCPTSTGCLIWPQVCRNYLIPLKMPLRPLDALSGHRCVKTPAFPQNALRPLDALSGHRYVKTPAFPQNALRPLDALSGHRYVKTPRLPSKSPYVHWMPYLATGMSKLPPSLKKPYVHWMPYLATGMSKLPPFPQNALRPLDALSGHRYVKTTSFPSRCPTSTGCPYLATGV